MKRYYYDCTGGGVVAEVNLLTNDFAMFYRFNGNMAISIFRSRR